MQLTFRFPKIELSFSYRVELSAQVSAVAAASGASANAKYIEGVMVFTIQKGGLMYEASVGGEKFKFEQ